MQDDGVLKIKIRFIDGAVFSVKIVPAAEFALTPVFLKFLTVTMLLFVLIGLPNDGLGDASLTTWMAAIIWTLSAATSLAWFYFVAVVVNYMSARGWISSVYSPLTWIPLIFINVVLHQSLIAVLILDTFEWRVQYLEYVVRDFAAAAVLDFFFSNFVTHQNPFFTPITRDNAKYSKDFASDETGSFEAAPPLAQSRALPDIAEGERPNSTSDNTHAKVAPSLIKLGKEEFLSDEILWIRAEDHYVTVATKNRRVLIRGRLSETIEALNMVPGIQVNRSCWVALSSIDKLADEGGKLSITLSTGEIEAVAQSRKFAVKSAYEQHASSQL